MSRRGAVWFVIVLMFVGVVVAAGRAAEVGSGAKFSSPETLKDGETTFVSTDIQSGDDEVGDIAVVPIIGEITAGSSSADGLTTGGDDVVALVRALRTQKKKHRVDGIILEVDSPGGGVLPSAEMAAELERAQDDGIKVVSWMRDVAASGGYYVSAGADRIVASPSTITGSIGVIMGTYNLEGLSEKIGVREVVIKSGKHKDMGSPFREMTKEEKDILQSLIDESYDEFVRIVSEGRDISEGEVREIADGRIYSGIQAQENGLVDDLGAREEVFEAMAEEIGKKGKGEKLRIRRFGRQFSFADIFSSSASNALGEAGAPGVDDLLGVFGADAARTAPVARGSAGVPGSLTLEYRMVVR